MVLFISRPATEIFFQVRFYCTISRGGQQAWFLGTTYVNIVAFIWITLEYSQTCSKDHLHQATTCLRLPTLSPPKPIAIQYNNHLPSKKNLCKTITTKLYPAKKWETAIKQQCIKNKCLSNYLLSSTTL